MLEYVLVAAFIFYLLTFVARRPPIYPPGPACWPFWGNFFHLERFNTQRFFDRCGKEYGPLTGLTVPGYRLLIANGWDVLNEILQNENCQGRPDTVLNRDRFGGRNLGLFFTDGPSWKSQRRFTLHHFRNLGFGKELHENVVLEEGAELVKTIRNLEQKPFIIEKMLYLSNINITWALLGGKRFEHDDKNLSLMSTAVQDILHNITLFGNLGINVPPIRFVLPEYRRYFKAVDTLRNFFKETIKTHMEDRDPLNPRDFIDLYLNQMEELENPKTKAKLEENGEVMEFSYIQLEGICTDLLLAGADTGTATVTFAILFLCLLPEVQSRIYREIYSVLGSDRQPRMSDKSSLVYIEAYLLEIFRYRTPVPMLPPHRVTADTVISGYPLEKDSIIYPNVKSVFMDKDYWGDPEIFRPERFISPDDKIIKTERMISFGKGKRSCLGETLAKMSLFTTFTSLVQKFEFRFKDNIYPRDTVGTCGFTIAPPHFEIVAIPRNTSS